MKLLTKSRRNTLFIVGFFAFLSILALSAAIILNNLGSFSVLSPKGTIARQEKDLLYFAVALSLIVIIPVYTLLFWIIFRYRAGNKKAKYRPEFDRSRILEGIWWGVPIILITILSIITWKSSHDLDPFKPIESQAKLVKIQVVSMNWKWLFIYPEENIAAVNQVSFPLDTPVEFQITGDSAMNSFWIPQLAGQIYAMPGMSTLLNIQAEEAGNYRGSSANISGRGFSGMKFTAKAFSPEDYENWLKKVKRSPQRLSATQYKKLARPSENHHIEYYGSVQKDLYNDVIRKYIEP